MERKAAQQNKTSANPRVLRHEESCDYTLIKLIQAEEQKFKSKNQSPDNHENPFALSLKANFTIIHA